MGKINTGRVLLGGLIGGLVLNIGEYLFNEVIFGEAWKDALAAFKLPEVGGGGIAVFLLIGWALMILTVWLYAAIRPRMGAGPKTAVCAGLFVWAFAYLYGSAGFLVIGLFPKELLMWGIVWGLFEVPIASVVGAYFYKEEE